MYTLRTYKKRSDIIETVINYLPSAILVLDTDTEIVLANKMAVQFANKSKIHLFGLRGGEAFDCIHAEDDPKGCGYGEACKHCMIRNTVETTIQTKKNSVNVEAPMEFIDKGQRVLTISTTWLSNNQLVIAALNDITELKRQEEIKIQNAELLAAVKTGGAVCHEMNQPLTVISGYIQLLEMGFIAREEWEYFITELNNNLERLRILSERLMHLEKYQTVKYYKDEEILDISY